MTTKEEAKTGNPQHHKNPIISIDWSSVSGVISSLSKSAELKLWKFKTIDPMNVFMYEGNRDFAKKFQEARRHLGINPNDSIDTRDLELLFEKQFSSKAKKVQIARDSNCIIVLTNDTIYVVHGIYNEGNQTKYNSDIQQFNLFTDIQQFYLDPKHDDKIYILRKNNSIYRIDLNDMNNKDKAFKIKLLTDGNDNDNDDNNTIDVNDNDNDTKTDDNDTIKYSATGNITIAAFDPVGTILVYVTTAKQIHLIDMEYKISPQVLDLSHINIDICSMSWTDDGIYLVTGDVFGGIRFWKRTASSMPKSTIQISEIVPRPIADNGSHQNDTPANLFSTQGLWNALGGSCDAEPSAWVIFDFDRKVEIHEFGFKCHGDTTHDVNEFKIECSEYPDQDDKWHTAGQFNGKKANRNMQLFKMKNKLSARYWRWCIMSRHSKYQAWIWNAKFIGCFEDATSSDKRILCECFKNNSRHYSNITFIETNGKLVLSGSADRTANIWCVGTKEHQQPQFCSKIMLDAEIYCGTLNSRNMKVWNPGSNSILIAGEFGTIFCFSITDILLNQKTLLLKNEDLETTLAAEKPPKIPNISIKELMDAEHSQIYALKNWINIWEKNEFVLASITTIIKPIFLYLEKDKLRYIKMLDSFVKSGEFGELKGILSSLQPLSKGPIRKQPSNNLLELYKISKDAHQNLQILLKNIVNKSHIHATYAGDPGLKKHLRCAQKTVLKKFKFFGSDALQEFDEKESLNYGNLCDMGRGGIVCRNVAHMVLVLKCIQDAVYREEIEIVRIKNRFVEPRNEGTGYRDIQFNIRFTIPSKIPIIRIIGGSGPHTGKDPSFAILTGDNYSFWTAKKQKNGECEHVIFDFGKVVECCRFDFAHYAVGMAVRTFNIQVTNDIDDDNKQWNTINNGQGFKADINNKQWQSFDFSPISSRYWRWNLLSTIGTAVIWNVKFIYTVKSIANWSLYQGVIVELQLHDENFFQIRKEAMGHKNYTASRFLIDFIDTAVDKLTVADSNPARDQIIMMVHKLLRGNTANK